MVQQRLLLALLLMPVVPQLRHQLYLLQPRQPLQAPTMMGSLNLRIVRLQKLVYLPLILHYLPHYLVLVKLQVMRCQV